MAKPQKSTAQSEVPGLVKKGPLYYLKRDWQLYALMLLPMVFIIVFKYFAYTGLSVAFLDYKIGKGYAGSKFVGLKIFEKVFKHRDFTKAVVNTLLLNVLDLIFSFPMPIILAPHLGVWGIWLATPLSWASGCIIPVVRYYSKEWMKRTLI